MYNPDIIEMNSENSFDTEKYKNANCIVLGTAGEGMHFSSKLNMINTIMHASQTKNKISKNRPY